MTATKDSKSGSSKWPKIFFFLSLLTAILVGLDSIKERFYIFDQEVLKRVAQDNLAKHAGDTNLLMANIAADLEKEYPGHVRLEEQWVFNNAGGAMGSMWILHGSLTEYVIFFGTPIGTEGHSGRFLADDYFIILEGEQWAHTAGELGRQVTKKESWSDCPNV